MTNKQLTIFTLEEEHLGEVGEVFSESNLKEQLPELFLQLTPFKPNKPGPKSKFIEETVMENVFGSVLLTGIELSVFDEDILLGILSTKKQIVGDEYYFVTSLRELSKLCGVTWRGATFDTSGTLTGNSTPKQILESIKRLFQAGLTINSYKYGKSFTFGIIESYANPLIDESKDYHYKQGVKDQIKIRLSKDFIYLYSEYKKYTIKLEDRIKIKSLLGKALYRYLKYIGTFKKTGIHKEGIDKLIDKINWKLPRKSKTSKYIAWRDVRRQLEDAKKGLERINIILEIPETLNEQSIIVFKNSSFHQKQLDI